MAIGIFVTASKLSEKWNPLFGSMLGRLLSRNQKS